MADGANVSNYILAGGTLLAASFVAIQAFYARTSYIEGEANRLVEKKLAICFDNFDAAAKIDAQLRRAVPGMAAQPWPPRVTVEDAAGLARLQRDVVPRLDELEAGLTKATVLGPLDKYRAYLAQQARGLSKRLLDLSPDQIGTDDPEAEAAFALLSEFLGAQYSVFTGCRFVAEGKA